MEDLTGKLPADPITALAPTSQAGGNMTSSNRFAMTAPGSPPVDPLPPSKDQGDPKITPSEPRIPVGDPGRPEPGHSLPSASPSWKKTPTAGAGPNPMRHD